MREIKVLDHGFVRLRNISGPTRRHQLRRSKQHPDLWLNDRFYDADDVDAPNAARMSFDQTDAGRTREMDMKLASYLMKNKHTSPFEMVQVWLEMKMPIFIARQFIRHRTARVNEVSGRYITLPAEWYIPEVVGGKAKSAKQGQEDNLDSLKQEMFKVNLNTHCASGYSAYMNAINDGVAAEHARMLLSLNHYTHWLWNQDMHNLMHLMSLRDHSHAQVEAQAYGRAIDQLIREVLPETMSLYDKFRRMPEPASWERCEELSNDLKIHEAIQNLMEDRTQDNATGLIKTILETSQR
jgi:thymidylate synthase (FAD)